MQKLKRFMQGNSPPEQRGINMVDLMMWLVIAAMLLAAAIQSIGYYQKSAYLYQMNAAVEVAAGKITAVAAIDGTVITQGIIDRVIAEENTATPNDEITLTAGSIESYASSGTEAGEYGFDRTSAATAITGGQSQYIKAKHDAVTDRESAYFFKATASYKVGINVVNTGVLDDSEIPDPTASAPVTPTPIPTDTTPVVVSPDFTKDPVWTKGAETKTIYGTTISDDGMKMAVAPSVYTLAPVSDGGRIRTSVDGGVTWTEQMNSKYANYRSITSSSDGSFIVAGEYDGSLWISQNSGADWREVTSTDGTTPAKGRWYGVSIAQNGKEIAAASNGGNIWVSHNFGASWTKVTTQIYGVVNATPPATGKVPGGPAGSGNWIALAQAEGGKKIIAARSSSYSYVSNDFGATWTENTAAGVKYWSKFASSEDGTTVASTTLQTTADSTSGKLSISKDFGQTWVAQTLSAGAGDGNWTGVTMTPDGTKILAGKVASRVAPADSDGALVFSADGGVTWKPQTSGAPLETATWYTADITPDGTKLIAPDSVNQKVYTGVVK